ncbi:Rgp1-domain-containing protein [Sphaerosporella brunnea]|uniref:Rgp1-domain-containing protein n=1 Tax=Sphaerosporella brunnea TaxID=1250544 RepID=A0A5J5EE74_9PEZI|nr:Rgp1-domain-containing protein [Sphaerosporella brunnea]
MSDIRVFVTFPESPAVFAGETLQCKITFKNVSQKSGPKGPTSSLLSSPTGNGFSLGNSLGARIPPLASPLQIPAGRSSGRISPRATSSRPPSTGFKLSLPHAPPSARSPVVPSSPVATSDSRSGHKHQRTVSIVSISSDAGIENGRASREAGLRSPPPMPRSRGHGRVASLQITPGKHAVPNGSTPASAVPGRKNSQAPLPAPISEAETLSKFTFPPRKPSAPSTPLSPNSRHGRSQSATTKPFEFPPTSATAMRGLRIDTNDVGPQTNGATHIDLRSPINETDNEEMSLARVIPAQSVCGETPRSSVEFYNMANSTTETLLSEYDPRGVSRLMRPSHGRRHSLLSIGPKAAESLMMGYAHVVGSFVLDGSLIQTSVFEDVKRKGVVGTHSGGGVVGLETSKSDGGFLSGLGWGLGGLLGGGGMSSIAEMKNAASAKSIPILSTPQSILFVDLRLCPGESRTYLFKFALPKNIPPSHRGKAIKITYNLVVGTQRPGKGVVQPSVVEIPFRVYPHVNGNGSLNTHDLMSPVVLLRDEATTECLEEPRLPTPSPPPAKGNWKQESSLEDFLAYVDDLLTPNESGLNSAGTMGLLSPSFGPNSKRLSFYDDLPATSKDAVEMALIGGAGTGKSSIFEIARNGLRVAAITLARPAYKLGENMTAIVDFSNAQIPCYHIHASLESSETVSPSLALRSPASIHRATRKVYAHHSESTLFANRILFTPTIPASATPEFSTSGVSNSWFLRFEFITAARSPNGPGTQTPPLFEDLLEQTYADDRGELYEPRQGVLVESFDASIPVKMYPNGAADVGTAATSGVQTGAAATVGFPV